MGWVWWLATKAFGHLGGHVWLHMHALPWRQRLRMWMHVVRVSEHMRRRGERQRLTAWVKPAATVA